MSRPFSFSSLARFLSICAVLCGFAAARPAAAQASCPNKKAMRPGTAEYTVQSGGLERRYLLHIPPAYDPTQPTPLVLSFHGFASNARQQEMFSDWDSVADAQSFIVVYPQGTGSPARWAAGRGTMTGQETVDDVQFFRDLLAALKDSLCIDPARVFVNGMSNGGGMANRLACDAAAFVAAAGSVAGAYTPVPGGCHPIRQVPIIAFHGLADPIVNFEGDGQMGLPPIKTWAADWAARNGCKPTPEVIPAHGDVGGLRYTGCAANADVVLYTIDGGGHTWPGRVSIPIIGFLIGNTSHDINASQTMWEFFKAHPMPSIEPSGCSCG